MMATLLALVFSEIDATSYANLSSPDGFIKLQWTYNSGKLIFKMTCKTTGWCAVGFTTTADGKKHEVLRYSCCWVRRFNWIYRCKLT